MRGDGIADGSTDGSTDGCAIVCAYACTNCYAHISTYGRDQCSDLQSDPCSD